MTFSSGNNMSTWQDKSGQGKTMTAVGSPVFQGGVNGILLNGTSQYFSNATPVLTNTYTIFFVYNKTSTTTGNLYSCYNSSANTGGYTGFFPTEGANYYLVRSDTSWASAASTIPNNNNNIVSVQYENNIVGGPISVFYNGSANISSTQTGTITYLNFTIGYRSYGSGPFLEYTQGYFYEVVAYSIVLTAPQRQQVESYLAQKWGLTGSLPAGHPGLNKIIHRNLQTTFSKKQYFTAFSPRQIPGCILWLDAADASSVTTSGTTVTAITDKSARATVLTSPAGFTYPNNTFNGSYPSFYNTSASGGRLGYNTTYSLGSQNTVFIVGQLTSPSVGNQFFDFIDGYASSSRFFLFSSPNNLNNYVYGTNGSSSGQVNGAITTAQMTSPFFWSVAFDTSTTISSTLQYVNGTQLVQSPSTLGAAISSYTGIIIGQRFTQSSESVVGHICEFIIFNNVLTATQRQQVESYLAQKWGLVSSLPAGHLNATFPAGSPTAIQAFVPRIRPALTNTIRLAIFSYTGSIQTYTVPAGKTSATIYIWGAAGGGDPYGNSGGAGAFITGIMPVTAGTTYYIVVGGGGRGLFDYPALYVNPGGYGGGATGYYAAGGGGYSGIFSGLTPAQGNTLLLAGGGGGAGPGGYGGSAAWSGTAQAGGGGGVAGSAGQGGTTSAGGAAGTPQTQGIADTTYPGTALAGGNGAQNYGGAGGGGYWGGGGGTYNNGANGGGGGSSYSNPTYLSSVSGAQSSTGSGSTVAPGNTNPYYVSGVGAAGVSGASGGNGLVVIN